MANLNTYIPDRVPLNLPTNEQNVIQGFDGRNYFIRDFNSFRNMTHSVKDLVNVDLDHKSVPDRYGDIEDGTAYGWMDDLIQEENGVINVAFNPTTKGRKKIEDGDYRFFSPVFMTSKTIDKEKNAYEIFLFR